MYCTVVNSLCFGETYGIPAQGEWIFWVDAEVMQRKVVSVTYGIAEHTSLSQTSSNCRCGG